MAFAQLPAATDVVAALEVEGAGYRALVDVLHLEQEALRAADANAILLLVATKSRQVEALRRQGGERSRALRAAGLPETAAGIKAWLGQTDEPARARDLWTKLSALAAQAQALNGQNGRLLELQRRHFDRAANALWHAAGHLAGYGADGRPQRGSLPRPLAAI